MNIDLSLKELELIADALFPYVLKKHTEAFNAVGDKKAELSNYANNLEDLGYKLWKAKEGISL